MLPRAFQKSDTLHNTDYASVTEVSGTKVSGEQIARMYTRYRFAAELARGGPVLEVACGSGQGLGCFAKHASLVCGLDIDMGLLRIAQRTYGGRGNIMLVNGNAHEIPYKDASFDTVVLFEALYYLKEPAVFIAEAKRVLRANGTLLMCTANREIPDFNPSPFSYRYFSASELCFLVRSAGFRGVCVFGDCPVPAPSLKSRACSRLKRAAIRMRVMPRTMKGKEFLKRVFMGPLVAMPEDISRESVPYAEPRAIPCDRTDATHKVVFVKADKPI